VPSRVLKLSLDAADLSLADPGTEMYNNPDDSRAWLSSLISYFISARNVEELFKEIHTGSTQTEEMAKLYKRTVMVRQQVGNVFLRSTSTFSLIINTAPQSDLTGGRKFEDCLTNPRTQMTSALAELAVVFTCWKMFAGVEGVCGQ